MSKPSGMWVAVAGGLVIETAPTFEGLLALLVASWPLGEAVSVEWRLATDRGAEAAAEFEGSVPAASPEPGTVAVFDSAFERMSAERLAELPRHWWHI